MDWNKINLKYPRAFNKFYAECIFKEFTVEMKENCDPSDITILPKENDLRRLFDFFDQQQIEIWILRIGSAIVYEIQTIWDGGDIYMSHSKEIDEFFNTRIEAEIGAFEIAFKILEEKLN